MPRARKAEILESEWVDVKVDIAEIKKDVSYIRKLLDGNGRNGVLSRLDKLERDVTRIMAIASVAGAAIGIVVNIVLKLLGM